MARRVQAVAAKTFVSVAAVRGERHLIFRTRRASWWGWRNAIASWLRRHWRRYALTEGGTLNAGMED